MATDQDRMMRFRSEMQSIGDLDRVTGTQMLFAFQRFVAIVLDGEVQDEAPMPESHRQVGVDEAGLPVMGLSSQPFVPSSDDDVPVADPDGIDTRVLDGPGTGFGTGAASVATPDSTDPQRLGESIEDYIARTAPPEHNPFTAQTEKLADPAYAQVTDANGTAEADTAVPLSPEAAPE